MNPIPVLPMILVITLASLSAQENNRTIDVQRSAITIHVGKAGLLSAAGHEHWVSAPISAGVMAEAGTPYVNFTVETAKMMVKPDPKVDEKTRARIQKDMAEMTLQTARYPEIAFRSSRVEKITDGQWKIEGTLALHGVTRPVSLLVKRSGAAYIGHTMIKQTDFGIKPVSVAGGTIRVKNDLDIDFQIFSGPSGPHGL